jgi:NitT/TauT family transport system substrate-binding protein
MNFYKEYEMKKIRFSLLAALLSAALISTGCAKKQAASDSVGTAETIEKIRLGVMTDSILAYAADIGIAEGIFAKHGLDVDVASFAAGINTIDAVTIGQMDIGFGADFAVLNRLGGSPATVLRIFTGLGEGSFDSWKLYAQGESIKTPADLAGKPVLVQLGTVGEYWYAKTFASIGVDLASVNFLPIDATLEGVALIQNGTAAAMWANARPAEALNKIAGVHVIADLHAVGSPTLSLAVAPEEFLTTRRNAAVKYLKAMDEIYRFIDNNSQRAAEIVQKASSTPVEQTLINLKNNTNYINFNQEIFDASDSLYRWAEDSGVIKYPYDLHTYVNVDALKAAFPGRGEFK